MPKKPPEIVWVRYDWDLQPLQLNVQPPPGYKFRSALLEECDAILDVVLAAYASDPLWRPFLQSIKQRMTERIQTTLGRQGSDYLVAEWETRIAAVSGIARAHWTGQNLLTGVCVLSSHQRKGIGTYLLAWSLLRLREMALAEAKVYTGANSLADRKLYPLFGSRREEGVDYPGLRQSLPSQE